MRPRGITDAMIARATAEAREEISRLTHKPELRAKAERMRTMAEAIKAEWQAKAAQGDAQAKRLLRECYPEDFAELDAAAAVLARPRAVPAPHWQEREPGEDEP